MNVAREQISVALFNLLKNTQQLTSLVKTITRVPRMWTEVPEAEKPQLLLFKGGPATEVYEQPQDRRIALTRFTIAYNLWLYVTANNLSSSGNTIETFINNTADAFDVALSTRILNGTYYPGQLLNERQTLGGIVNNVYRDGGSEWSREFQDGNIVCMWQIHVQTGN